MFEEMPFLVGFLVVSLVLSLLFFRVEYKPLKIVIQGLAIIGVIIHEISPVLMCFVTNTKIDSVVLVNKVENEGQINKVYGGQVNILLNPRISFLQALVIGLAPLFISFWIFFFLLHELYNPNITDFLAIFYVFIMVSLILGSAPSKGDWNQIASAFTCDIEYTFYQIFLVVISIFSVYNIVPALQIPIIHESINYIFILVGYYVFKYVIKGVNRVIKGIFKKTELSKCQHENARKLWRRMDANEREVQW